ncbi:fungal-specific transcription factor domain-containing protein [Lasiosphaeris hirsuta]|uniref:Fungal-specific transcription factor domain-containing protein n=1 Tax=Lasiosphaeris hirsuta TaxID=260670 RepID=A0AA40AY77_9PEZI|nr:fungal-specific transcription factor domain-containing protein [Lasiosphaeris hirsuta]
MDAVTNEAGNAGGDYSFASSDLSTPEQKKRNRIRFSCTTCRDKKLKCNRQSPCDQCEKRGITSTCRFVPYENPSRRTPPSAARNARDASTLSSVGPAAPRAKAPLGESALIARLKHLEHIVLVLKSQRRESVDSPSNSGSALGRSPNPAADPKHDKPEQFPQDWLLYGKKATLTADQRYVDSATWESVLDDITTLTRDLKTEDEPYDECAEVVDHHVDDHISALQGPVLLLGGFPRMATAEMAALLPPRIVVDRMLARFFQTREHAWMMFHIPTFMKHYKLFWETPHKVTYTWIGLLFALCAHSCLYSIMANEELPGNMGDPQQLFDEFRVRAAQCLTLADYTKPGRYKVQAMILYFGTEFLRRNEAMLGTSTLLSITIRLAMHMGMHRDPKHYPGMTPYDGEMRRRMWTLLREIDLLVSFQFGLPPNITAGSYDTEPPRNLHDEDFDEDSKKLPPARPETERTVSLLTVVKARMMDVFATITAAIGSREPISYAEIMRIDKMLKDAHDKIPPILQYRPFRDSIADPVDVIMQRYWLELLYQKSRAVLHRKYMCLGRRDNRYMYSRKTSIDAAMHTLRHQYDIHYEIQTGGRLSTNRWFMDSLSVHDFLLADMILCLELSYLKAKDQSPDATELALKAFSGDTCADVLTKDQIMEILATSRSIWQMSKNNNAEASRAYHILSKLLTLSTGDTYESSPESINSPNETASWPPLPFYSQAQTGSNFFSSSSGAELSSHSPSSNSSTWTPSTSSNGQAGRAPLPTAWTFDVPSLNTADIPPLDGLDGLVDPSLPGLNYDWTLWDNRVQNMSIESDQIPWDTFFPTS